MLTVFMFLFLLLSISAIVALVVGLIKPERVIRWGATRTRPRVLLITVPTILVSFIFASYFASKSITPEEKLAMDKKREEQQIAKEQEKKKKAEEKKIQQENEKKEKEENERKQKEAKEKKAQEEAEDKVKKEAEEQQKQAELEKKKQEQQEKKAQEELKKQEKEAAAFENNVKKVVNKKFGEKKVESIQINDNLGTENENDKIVLITAEGKENVSKNYTKKGMWTDTVSILKDLSNEKNISEITFFYKYPLIDAYGNEKKDTVMKINLNRDTLDKINFDNFSYDNLPKISNQYWEHPMPINLRI
ncbi:hypothetical protein ACQVTS_31460 [Bacillus mycoides]|uniref:hypothetical protein n=2 Tax=Bacillus mycoides TaxID=1405 RepID=UPI003D65D09B